MAKAPPFNMDLDDEADLSDLPGGDEIQSSLIRYSPPQKGLTPPNPINPAALGFPPMLPFELVMRTASVPDICAAYGITREEFSRLIEDPVFVAAHKVAQEQLAQDGMSFKVKAKMQAEALLTKAWEMVHNQACPFNVRADMLKSIVRWADYEPKRGELGSGGGQAFQLNINLHSGKVEQPGQKVIVNT